MCVWFALRYDGGKKNKRNTTNNLYLTYKRLNIVTRKDKIVKNTHEKW